MMHGHTEIIFFAKVITGALYPPRKLTYGLQRVRTQSSMSVFTYNEWEQTVQGEHKEEISNDATGSSRR